VLFCKNTKYFVGERLAYIVNSGKIQNYFRKLFHAS